MRPKFTIWIALKIILLHDFSYPQLDENVELSSDPHTVGKRTLPAIYTCVNLYGILRWCQLLLKFTIGFTKNRYFMKNDY